MKDYINIFPNAERRYVNHTKVEVRAESEGIKTIRGYAAMFNISTDLGWCKEIIQTGAFDDCLEDDIRCLFNHESEYILGRTSSKTCRVGVDNVGLWYECDLDESNTDHMNLYRSIMRGDINQSSFAFSIKEQNWTFSEGEDDVRTIIKCERLYDVSPVTYPAYESTTVSARAKADYDQMKKQIEDEKQSIIDEANERDAFVLRHRNFKLKHNIQK